MQIRPEYPEAHNNLAIVLAMDGRKQDAIGHWREALRWNPELADAHNNLAYALSEQGLKQEALAHYEQALRIQPDYVLAQVNLARFLATDESAGAADRARAVALAERACQLTANANAGYLDTLAVAYAAANRFDDAVRAAQSALQVARAAQQAQLAGQIESRLQWYREHRR